jgi:hypothetical protein
MHAGFAVVKIKFGNEINRAKILRQLVLAK